MSPESTLWTLVIASMVFLLIRAENVHHRTLHRLVGGHLSVHPDLEDAELIITSSAGGGREGKQKGSDSGDGEDKKTLSQQVADGKYGLIQKELFSKPIKRPGIISYEANPEVPKDNINNLGGLNKNDIWLAENHLLVIKGGAFPPHDSSDNRHSAWEPIDDYKAPGRQVKIPANPKVPPPFPVQLYENGPLQILGTNTTTTLNGTFSAAPYPLPPQEGGFYPAYPPGDQYPPNITSGEAPFPIPPFPPQGEYAPPFPPINGSLPPLPPYFASLPPGAAILPPPGNNTDYDEDDPSIYYPPPYSFYYQLDNSSHVPPGPLVPGIVLPPPPDFFAPLEPKRKKPATVRPTRPTIRPITTTEIVNQIHPTTSTLPATPVRIKPIQPVTTEAPVIVTILPVKYHTTNRTFTPITTTLRPYIPSRHRKPSVTVLKPVKPSTSTPRPIYFYENNEVNGRPFKLYGPPTRQRTVISSTQIPLKAYYSTSNEIDTNSVTQVPPNYYPQPQHVQQAPKTTKQPPAQYYFYEEEAVTKRTPKQKAQQSPYFNLPKEYYIPAKPANNVPTTYHKAPKAQQVYYITNRPPRPSTSRYRFVEATKKPDTFSVHVARLKQQIHQYYTTPDPYYERPPPPSSSKPVYQFSFQAANYQPQHNSFRASPIDGPNEDGQPDEDKFRPINKYSVQIQPAIEVLPNHHHQQYRNPPAPTHQPAYYKPSSTLPPKYYSTARPIYDDYDDEQKTQYVATPRPISQYSFQAAPTPNPLYQPYYTKQEEPYFDDITKKYFTIFGKKIQATTPLSTNIESTTKRPRPVQIQYAQSPQIKYNQYEPAGLHSDININYKQPQPQINQDAEIVEAIPIKLSATNTANKQGSFISYELPGDDGAHFYFLTPQLAQRRDQGAGYYYENPDAARIRRSKDS